MAATDRKTKKAIARPGTLAGQLIILLLKCYQTVLSPLLGPRCRFYPSCSHYAVEAINEHGVIRGGAYTAKRLAKCHPFHPGGIDQVPQANSKASANNRVNTQVPNSL